MGILAWIFGSLGGLCAVMGIITAFAPDLVEVVPVTAMFWLALGAVLLLASIAFAVARSAYE